MKKNWQRIKENSALLESFLLREKVIDALRLFFKNNGFHEVETPLLASCPGAEPYLNLFETRLEMPTGQSKQAFLLTSPEYSMKKLLTAGLGNIFQICKSFRNQESLGGTHNPEFTILEFYRINADYKDLMKDFEQMLFFVVKELGCDPKHFKYQGREFDLTSPFPKFSVAELFDKYLGLNADQLLDPMALRKKAFELDYDLSAMEEMDKEFHWEELYNRLFLNEIESKLSEFKQPVFVHDYPAPQAALSKKKKDDPRFAQRFEVYLAGVELGNAFSELTDAKEQKQRLEEELQLRRKLGKKEQKIDQDFIAALEAGMPESSGIAIGVDRLIMLFADVQDINEVLFFPAKEAFLD